MNKYQEALSKSNKFIYNDECLNRIRDFIDRLKQYDDPMYKEKESAMTEYYILNAASEIVSDAFYYCEIQNDEIKKLVENFRIKFLQQLRNKEKYYIHEQEKIFG